MPRLSQWSHELGLTLTLTLTLTLAIALTLTNTPDPFLSIVPYLVLEVVQYRKKGIRGVG